MADDIVITETTVRAVGKERVGMGNIWKRDVDFADATTRNVMSCMLFPGDDTAIVAAVGLKVVIDGERYSVVEVVPGSDDDLGHVSLRPEG